MWLTVWAATGTNARYPCNIAILGIKREIALACSHYEGKEVFIYDAVECILSKTVKHGGYEYLDDYVVKADARLFCSLESQNVAGDPHAPQTKEWDGLTHVQIHDLNRWEMVLLPSTLPEGQALTINMLKRSVLVKLNQKTTNVAMQEMRVYRNDGGVPTGLPLKGTDAAFAHLWYTAVISKDASLLVRTSGEDMPSPDSYSDEIASWEDVQLESA